jgi:hypothetical protein
MHRSYDRGVQTAGRFVAVASAVLVALAVAACGENDPGDPVSIARDLSSPVPSGGRVDVYCSPALPITADDRPDECTIDLKLAEATSMAEAETWLIAVGQRVRPSVGRVFAFDGRRFVWSGIFLERFGDSGRLEYVCDGVVRPIYYVPSTPIAPGTVPPLPATSSWFTSIADARAARCRLAVDDASP